MAVGKLVQHDGGGQARAVRRLGSWSRGRRMTSSGARVSGAVFVFHHDGVPGLRPS
jgi:hypothetical protein